MQSDHLWLSSAKCWSASFSHLDNKSRVCEPWFRIHLSVCDSVPDFLFSLIVLMGTCSPINTLMDNSDWWCLLWLVSDSLVYPLLFPLQKLHSVHQVESWTYKFWAHIIQLGLVLSLNSDAWVFSCHDSHRFTWANECLYHCEGQLVWGTCNPAQYCFPQHVPFMRC